LKKFALILSVLILSGLAACSKQADRAQDDRFDVNKHSDMANIYKQYEATPAPGK
jgi:hypothetical protein